MSAASLSEWIVDSLLWLAGVVVALVVILFVALWMAWRNPMPRTSTLGRVPPGVYAPEIAALRTYDADASTLGFAPATNFVARSSTMKVTMSVWPDPSNGRWMTAIAVVNARGKLMPTVAAVSARTADGYDLSVSTMRPTLPTPSTVSTFLLPKGSSLAQLAAELDRLTAGVRLAPPIADPDALHRFLAEREREHEQFLVDAGYIKSVDEEVRYRPFRSMFAFVGEKLDRLLRPRRNNARCEAVWQELRTSG